MFFRIKVLSFYIILNFVFINVLLSTTYYVTTGGNNSNNGLSENTAWQTVTFAGLSAQAGDTVYIKAGEYNGERVKFSYNGTSTAPILFEGYKDNPGDINDTNWWQYGDSLNPSQMPLLDGGDRSNYTCFDANDNKYIVIKNFQITNYSVGISLGWSSTAHHNKAENIIAVNFGKLSSDPEVYNGKGISFSLGHDFSLTNCTVVNAGAEGISFSTSDNNVLDNCKVYCDQGYSGQPDVNAATDYYIVLSGNNNIIRDCYIERVGDLDHGGAGIGIKGSGENNLFENCVAKNLRNAGFYVRHSGVKYNTFKKCTAIGGINGDGFIIRDGAAYNNFYSCKTESIQVAVGFYFTNEDPNADYAGHDNSFYNCIFENTQAYIISYSEGYVDKPAENNRFINCVFNSAEYMFSSNRDNSNNQMINCIVANVSAYKFRSGKNINFVYSYTDFWNLGFSLPQDSYTTYDHIITTDPKWTDAGEGDYHLSSTSPCIDVGKPDTAGLNLPEFDFYDNPRLFDSKQTGTAIVDMGIHEFPEHTTAIEQINTSPGEFNLKNNFPNPFNPTTTISFSLPISATVCLAVYNILGEKVTELLNTKMSSGNHSIVFNASDLSSGIYIYKLSAIGSSKGMRQNYVVAKKMMLVR